MTKDELIALATKVEALTGPDRIIDAEVAAAIRYFPATVGFVWRGSLLANSPEPGRVECHTEGGTGGPHYAAYHYTALLDAALTLVPEGWAWMAGFGRKPMAYVHNGESAFIGIGTRSNPARRWFEVSAATPALALVCCALRAHATTLGD